MKRGNNMSIRRASRLLILLLGILALHCAGPEGGGTANPQLNQNGAPTARRELQARLGPADQILPVGGGTFTRMPFHGFKAISSNGNLVLFLSQVGGTYQLYLHDRAQNTDELISQSSAGVMGNGDTTYGAMSSDGNVVVFASQAVNLDGPGQSFTQQIFVRNRAQQTTRLVTTVPDDSGGDSIRPSISGDGSTVVFESRNPSLTGDTGTRAHILKVDVATGAVTVLTSGAQGDSQNPDISRDGRWVVYNGKLLATSAKQIFRVDLQAPDAPQVISSAAGVAGDRDSFNPTINADGSVVAFETMATNLGPAGSDFKVVAWDGSLHAVSGVGGTDSSPSHLASLSDDGRFVGFVSTAVGIADTVNGPVAAENTRTFVHRRDTGETALVSRTETEIGDGVDVLDFPEDLQALNPEVGPRDGETAVSGDGTMIAYTSFSQNLGGQVNGSQHVYVSENPLFGATLRFVPNPPFAGVSSGQTFQVTVEADNEDGVTDTTFNGPITLSVQGNNVSLGGTVTVNAVQGVASFTNLTLTGANQPGVTLMATAGSGTPFLDATSQPFAITDGFFVFVTQPAGTGQIFPGGSIAAGQKFQVQVQATKPDGLTVDTTFTGPVTLALTGAATLNGVLVQNAVNGVATFPNLDISGAPTTGLTLTASGQFPDIVSAPFDLAASVNTGGGILGVTTDNGNTLNIYRSDNATGALTAGPSITLTGAAAIKPWNFDSTTTPRFLVCSATTNTLTSVGVDRDTGNLTILDSETTPSTPVDVEIFNDSVAFVLCNGTGEVVAFPLNDTDGSILPAVQTVKVGTSPVALKYVDVPGNIDFLVVANNGSNDFSVLSWDTGAGILTTVLQGGNATKANLPLVAGPNGIDAGALTAGMTSFGVWAPNAMAAGSVSAFTLNPVTGQLTDVATTTAGNVPGSPFYSGLDGFLYVSNLNSNDINGYTVDPGTADLTHLGAAVSSGGTNPDRLIGVTSQTGTRFLYVGNDSFGDQSMANVNGFVRNADGSLTPVAGLPLTIPFVSKIGYIPSP